MKDLELNHHNISAEDDSVRATDAKEDTPLSFAPITDPLDIEFFHAKVECDEHFIVPNIEIIPDCEYRNHSMTSLEIPNTVTTIGAYAFEGCEGLKTVEIPDSVKYIGSCAFAFSGVESISFGKNVQFVGRDCFEGSKLKTILIHPENSYLKLVDGILYRKKL